jgi:serine/threonine protein kinase/Tol biopolymer transport system component
MSSRKASTDKGLQPGTTFSHYEVRERIGGGGMGTVYRARDTRLGRDVAIKVINPEIAEDPDRIARFHREARIVAGLTHPAIVTIHDTGEEHGVAYLVTELVGGTTLRSVLEREGALASRRVVGIGSQIADALAAAHAAGVTHRDIKPENVMLTHEGRAKLLDFGLARSGASRAEHYSTKTVMYTEVGVVLGTIGYMSPEQVRGDALDARSDIFSLGVVLYEMAAETRPFTGATPADVSSAVLHADPPPLQETSTPAGLRQIIERCLNKRPADRFQSASDLAFALSSVSARPSTASGTDALTPSFRYRAWIAAMLVAVTLGAGALGIVRTLTSPEANARVRLRPFATDAHGETQPIWSPDGRSIAYVSAVDGRQRIVVKSVNAPGVAPVLGCPAICDTVAWSSDGQRIFYQSRTSHLDARLWSVARTGGEPTPVFRSDVQVLASGISVDGKRLAVLRVITLADNEGLRYGLFLSQPPGAEPVRVESFPLLHLITPTRVAWSADSGRLLVASSGPSNVYVVSLATGKVSRLPVAGAPDVSFTGDPRFAVAALPSVPDVRSGLQWLDTNTGDLSPLVSSESVLSYPKVSPDGSRVAYVANDTDYDLVEIPLNGSPVRPLLASRVIEHSVHYSPRTDEFAYVAAGEAPEIRVRQPTTLAERVVVSQSDFSDESGVSRFSSVAFSPDGTRLAYNRNFEIWISPSNGGAPAKLTQHGGEFAPEWSPDGSWIAFNYATPTWGGLAKVQVGAGNDAIRLRPGMCGAVAPAWSPDGAWIACGRDPMGLDLVPAGGGEPRFLGAHYEPVAVWSRDAQHLYVIRDVDGRRELGELMWRSGSFRRITSIPSDFAISNAMSWAGRMSLSRDSSSLAAAVVRATGDIWILDGVRPPRAWWQRITRQ